MTRAINFSAGPATLPEEVLRQAAAEMLDWHGSGMGVIRALNGAGQGRSLVVLSNYATKDIRRKCLELGADRVFDKSTEIDALIQYCGWLTTGATGPGELAQN